MDSSNSSSRKRLLFVCIENSNRSQMAEAFARLLGGEDIEAYSAGSRPSGQVNPRAVESMKEIGYDLSVHGSKAISEVSLGVFDVVVSMGCGDACPHVPAKRREEWQIPDPKELEGGDFAQVRDEIRANVEALLVRLERGE